MAPQAQTPRPVPAPADDVQWDDDIQWDPSPATSTAPPPGPLVRPDAFFQTPPKAAGALAELPSGPPDSLSSKVMQFGLELGGGLLGSRLPGVSFLPRVVASALGSGAGTALGTVAGKLGAGAPPAEIPAAAAESFLFGTGGDLAASGVAKGFNLGRNALAASKSRLAAPLAGKLAPAGAEATTVLEGTVTPGQVSDSHWLHTLDNIMSGAVFGSGRYRALLKEQGAKLERMADDILQRYGPEATTAEAGSVIRTASGREATRRAGALGTAKQRVSEQQRTLLEGITARHPRLTTEQAGQAWQELQALAHERERAVADSLYQRVAELAGPEHSISLEPVIDVARKEMESIPEMARALSGKAGTLPTTVQRTAQEVVPTNDPGGLAALERLYNISLADATGGLNQSDNAQALMLALKRAGITPEQVQAKTLDFVQAHRLRSEFGQLIGDARRRGDGTLEYAATQYFKTLDNAMNQAAGGPGTPLRQTYDEATATWKQMKQSFEEGVLAKVAEKDPRLVVSTLIRPGGVEDIRKAQQLVGPEAWRKVQQAFTTDLFQGTSGVATVKELRTKLKALKPETLDAIYGPQGSEEIRAYIRKGFAKEVLDQQTGAWTKAATAAKDQPVHTLLAKTLTPGDVEGATKLRALVGESDWPIVQSALAGNLLTDEGTLVTGAQLTKRLHAYGTVLDEVFPPKDVAAMHQLARIMEQVQGKTPGNLKMWIQLSQGGALAGLGVAASSNTISWDTAKRAGVLLLSPGIVARLALSPTGRQWLTTGLKAAKAKDAGMVTKAGTQILGLLTKWGVFGSGGAQGGPPPGSALSELQAPAGRGPGPRGAGTPPPGLQGLPAPGVPPPPPLGSGSATPSGPGPAAQ